MVRRIVSSSVEKTSCFRYRALLLVGFTGAFRRSEIVALEFRDISFVKEGVEATLRRSKTDQIGKGECYLFLMEAILTHAQ